MPGELTTFENSDIHTTKVGDFTVTCFITNYFRQNAYIVTSLKSDEAIIIDPGGRSEHITDFIRQRNVQLRQILLTHGHFDHIGALNPLCTTFSLNARIHEQDLKLARLAPFYALRFCNESLPAPRALLPYGDESEFPYAGRVIKILPLPGHTKGGVAIDFGDFVFTGDSLFHEKVGPTNYPESDLGNLLEGVSRLFTQLAPDSVIFPGHGRPWTIGEGRVWWETHKGQPPQYQIMRARKGSDV